MSVRDDVDLEELLFEVSESDASVRWEMMLTWNSLALKSLRAMQVFVGDDAYLKELLLEVSESYASVRWR